MHSSPFNYLVASAPPFVHFTADELRYTAASMDADNLELKDIVPMASIKKKLQYCVSCFTLLFRRERASEV